MRQLVLGLALLLLGPVAGCKGDAKKCEAAARNFAEVVYKEKMEKELAELPADQREAARKEKLAKYANEVEKEIDFFIRQCVAANNDEQVECMLAAKTSKQALACAELIKPE
jgi:hypothetical protein